MWECGLKPPESVATITRKPVTPYVGVWIETADRRIGRSEIGVTPYVGVWIETQVVTRNGKAIYVTPYVGVWIETGHFLLISDTLLVTPYVGVWIETMRLSPHWYKCRCHSLCGSVD